MSKAPSRKHPSKDGNVGGNVTLPPIDATPEEIAQTLFQRPPLKKPSAEDAGESQKVCPECGHVFQGNGWDGVDAHWRSKHEDAMPYEEAWPLLRDGKYPAQPPAISTDPAPTPDSAA